jgi:hydroxyacylglutathione hydrolase
MNLEDHIGDIIRKARQMSDVSPETAAAAAGLTLREFEALEQSGRAATKPKWRPLAGLLGLHPTKFETLAQGWAPMRVDVALWRELRPITTAAEGMTVNCYLVWDEVTLEGALFDTGWEAAEVFALLEENAVELKHLFLTHTHEDHLAALGQLREKFPKLKLHSGSRSAPPDQRNRANDFLHLGSLRITNRDTPGHAEDGVSYIVGGFPDDAPYVAMVGDALFAGSMGSALQAPELAKDKIRQQLFTLPPATLICPGHGPLTTVAEEKAHNPFF